MGAFTQPCDWANRGLECDKMSREAVRFHLDAVFAELHRRLGPDLRAAGLTHILLDSYEAGTPTWTPEMPAEFRRRRGYDPTPYLPILGGYTNLYTAAEAATFRRDFDRTVKDLYRDVLFAEMGRRVRAEGLELACEPYGGPFATAEAAPHVDRLMTEFWFTPDRPAKVDCRAWARSASLPAPASGTSVWREGKGPPRPSCESGRRADAPRWQDKKTALALCGLCVRFINPCIVRL